jgi:hypothetical protein
MTKHEAVMQGIDLLSRVDSEADIKFIMKALSALKNEPDSTPIIFERLKTYVSPKDPIPKTELWKTDTDLTMCTPAERSKLHQLGLSLVQVMDIGLTRGEVAHICFGYEHQKREKEKAI